MLAGACKFMYSMVAMIRLVLSAWMLEAFTLLSSISAGLQNKGVG